MDGPLFVENWRVWGNLEKLGDLCAFEGILEEFGGFFRWLDEFGCSDSAEFGKMSKEHPSEVLRWTLKISPGIYLHNLLMG